MSYHQADYDEKLIQEMKGKTDFTLPEVEDGDVPDALLRTGLDLPNLPEREVVRHVYQPSLR